MAARTVPPVPAFLAGQKLTATGLNLLGTWMSFWSNPPMFRMYQTIAQNVTTGADTQITMDTSAYDTDSGRSGTTPWSYTIPVGMGGRWTFTVSTAWASNATGLRAAELRVNGSIPTSDAYEGIPPVSGNLTVVSVTVTVPVNAGDVISGWGYQSSGGTLATAAVAGIGSYFEGRLVSLANP